MRKTAREIIFDVESHLACSKKKYYSDFYIGIDTVPKSVSEIE